MSMDHCWRWFGPRDPISLREVKQTGAGGVVTALHEIPTGETWTADEILSRKRMIENEGLRWVVAESLPVHEAIKLRTPDSPRLIENYRASIRNLGACGVRVLCYNFMPVLDWSRTSLETVCADGTITTSFDRHALAAFDIWILNRPRAEEFYDSVTVSIAREFFLALDESAKDQLVQTVLLGFPGSGERYTLDRLRDALQAYRGITREAFRDNLLLFLRDIAPAAEDSGVLLALHPDDPPWSVLGLPHVVTGSDDISRILSAVDSPSNGITLCTGSLGASRQNNVVDMAERYARRINFVHLRNVVTGENGDFLESDHLEGDVDMFGVIRSLLLEQRRRADEGRPDSRIPMRPDHGHLADADRRNYYPGYSLFGRMRGLAELRGLEMGIQRSLGL